MTDFDGLRAHRDGVSKLSEKREGLPKDIIMLIALEWFTTGDNKSFPEGYRYRSLGIPRDVKERDLINFARAVERMHGIGIPS